MSFRMGRSQGNGFCLCVSLGCKTCLQQSVDGLHDLRVVVRHALRALDDRVGKIVGQGLFRVDDIVGVPAEHFPEIGSVIGGVQGWTGRRWAPGR